MLAKSVDTGRIVGNSEVVPRAELSRRSATTSVKSAISPFRVSVAISIRVKGAPSTLLRTSSPALSCGAATDLCRLYNGAGIAFAQSQRGNMTVESREDDKESAPVASAIGSPHLRL